MPELDFKDTADDFLEHIGKKRRSGRYPWGSGSRPYQSGGAPSGEQGKGDSGSEGNSKSGSKPESNMSAARKSVNDMTNDELKTELERLRMQTEYLRLNDQLDKSINPTKEKSAGKEFATTMAKQILMPIVTDIAKTEIKKGLAKAAAAQAAKTAAKAAASVIV